MPVAWTGRGGEPPALLAAASCAGQVRAWAASRTCMASHLLCPPSRACMHVGGARLSSCSAAPHAAQMAPAAMGRQVAAAAAGGAAACRRRLQRAGAVAIASGRAARAAAWAMAVGLCCLSAWVTLPRLSWPQELYKGIGWPLYRLYGHAFDAFKTMVQDDGEAIFQRLEADKGGPLDVLSMEVRRGWGGRRAEVERGGGGWGWGVGRLGQVWMGPGCVLMWITAQLFFRGPACTVAVGSSCRPAPCCGKGSAPPTPHNSPPHHHPQAPRTHHSPCHAAPRTRPQTYMRMPPTRPCHSAGQGRAAQEHQAPHDAAAGQDPRRLGAHVLCVRRHRAHQVGDAGAPWEAGPGDEGRCECFSLFCVFVWVWGGRVVLVPPAGLGFSSGSPGADVRGFALPLFDPHPRRPRRSAQRSALSR